MRIVELLLTSYIRVKIRIRHAEVNLIINPAITYVYKLCNFCKIVRGAGNQNNSLSDTRSVIFRVQLVVL